MADIYNDFVRAFNDYGAKLLGSQYVTNLVSCGNLPTRFCDDVLRFLKESLARFSTDFDGNPVAIEDSDTIRLENQMIAPSGVKFANTILSKNKYSDTWNLDYYRISDGNIVGNKPYYFFLEKESDGTISLKMDAIGINVSLGYNPYDANKNYIINQSI